MKELFSEEIRLFNAKGWSPATSTNYSFRNDDSLDVIHVSKSGKDKSHFSADDFMDVDRKGTPLEPYVNIKCSAETLIHCTLYDLYPETMFIVHSHSKYAVLQSMINDQSVSLEGYEVLKGFPGIHSHETAVEIPIFENDQDMLRFSEVLRSNKNRISVPVFIMRKHGVYAWGKTLAEAKRHLEVAEYLFDVEYNFRTKKHEIA